MKLRLMRRWFSEKTTIGELYVDGVLECYTLEDRVRAPGVKVKAQTAISPGRYFVVIDQSARFRRRMPHVLDVPMFEGIRIHAGNTEADTEGCILVGSERGTDSIQHSAVTFAILFSVIEAALVAGPVVLEIVNVEPPEELLRVA